MKWSAYNRTKPELLRKATDFSVTRTDDTSVYTCNACVYRAVTRIRLTQNVNKEAKVGRTRVAYRSVMVAERLGKSLLDTRHGYIPGVTVHRAYVYCIIDLEPEDIRRTVGRKVLVSGVIVPD